MQRLGCMNVTELGWDGRKSVVHCKALSDRFRVMNYLSSSSHSDVNTWLSTLVFLEGRHD